MGRGGHETGVQGLTPAVPAPWGRGGTALRPWWWTGSRPALSYSLSFYAVESPNAKDILLVTRSSLHHVRGKRGSTIAMS